MSIVEVLRLEKLRVVGTPELPRDLEHHWLVVKQLLLRDHCTDCLSLELMRRWSLQSADNDAGG